MVFRMGRLNIDGEADAVHHKPEQYYNSLQAERLGHMNLSPEEYVALMGGIHTLGFKDENKSGPLTRWTMNPYVFDNTYFQ